ncbi:MAG: OpgC family protein [Pseudochelatococcus sp.]|uniref:OpgC family protein n=1 Tax=Pseudochelatococcus sp. TaxID=2020869 RepID=UPI003D92C08B
MHNGNGAGAGQTGRGQPEFGRIETIDFWRGLVLVIIFINHVPGNIFETFTPRNFGFSDSAEAFVFISGMSVALAYGGSMSRGDVLGALNKAWRRASLLYVIHLLLTFTAIALFANAFVLTGKEIFLLGHGRDVIFDDPSAALLGIVSLGHQLGYYNILPLYILLMLCAPFILLAAWRSPMTTLTVSFVIYAIAQAPQVNLPSWPVPGLWFLNPFAWQLAFVIGVVTVVVMRRSGDALPGFRWLTAICALLVVAGIVLTTNCFGYRPGLFDAARALGGFDKTDMNVMRLAHFLALAYLLARFRVGDGLMRIPAVGSSLALMGRHGLAVFALGSVLSSAGQIFATMTEDMRLSGTTLTGLAVVPAGIMCLYWLARYLAGPATVAGAAQSGPAVARA